MKRHCNICKITCILCLFLLLAALAGCRSAEQETTDIFPCYFNRDVEGMDAQAICAALESAGWEKDTRQAHANVSNTTTAYTLPAGEVRKVIVIEEFPSCGEAEQSFAEQWSVIAGGDFAQDNEYHMTLLRISDCTVTTLRDAHVDLMETLRLGTVEALEVPLENTYEMCKDTDSVDIEAVKAAMEADGYQFYASEFFAGDDQDGSFSSTYIFFSPKQDRIYAYTLGKEPTKWGLPYAYWTYQTVERMVEQAGVRDLNVGIHFVGFKDGSCVLCYGDSFEQIRAYFAQ